MSGHPLYNAVAPLARTLRRKVARGLLALLDDEPLAHTFFEQVPDTALVMEYGVIVDANPAAVKHLGYSRTELIGLQIGCLFKDPEDEKRLVRALAAGPITDYPLRLRTAAGDTLECLVSATARLDRNGKVIGGHGLARDVTERNRIETEMRSAERDYRGLFDNAHDAILILDPFDETVLDANQRACVLYGVTREDFMGRSMAAFSVNPEYGRSLLKQTREGSGLYAAFESQQVRADGSVFDVEINAAIVPYKGQNVILSINRDFSARRVAEKAIRESEERFRLLIESLTGYVIVMLDPSGSIVSWHDGAERITGYTDGEVLGRQLTIFDEPDDPITLQEQLAVAAEWGRFERETTWVRKDGTVFAAAVTLTRIVTEPGGLRGFAVVTRDITQRLELESARQEVLTVLREIATEWTATFDTVDVPIVFLGADGEIHRLNRAAQELARLPFTEVVNRQPSKIAGEPWQTMASVARQTFARGSAERARAVEGDSVWQVSSYAVDSAGAERQAIVVAYDLTRVTNLETMVRRNEVAAALGAMVAGVAHEVRNPLFTISAGLDAWEARFGDSEGMRRYAGPLRDQVSRLSRLMQDLLEYGKPNPLVLQEVSPLHAIRAGANDCGAIAAERSATVVIDAPDDLPYALLDSSRLEQVFQNIIDNAVRHSPAGGEVRVEARFADGHFLVSVLDEGPGVSEEDKQSAFVPFYTRRRGGTGLGLAIARNIVVLHGGSVTLANREDRGGTIVTVRLPAREQQSQGLESAAW